MIVAPSFASPLSVNSSRVATSTPLDSRRRVLADTWKVASVALVRVRIFALKESMFALKSSTVPPTVMENFTSNR
jgi:hypothetical protein